jgi:hypothetical protein
MCRLLGCSSSKAYASFSSSGRTLKANMDTRDQLYPCQEGTGLKDPQAHLSGSSSVSFRSSDIACQCGIYTFPPGGVPAREIGLFDNEKVVE